jgi:hypothetical protein
MVLRVGDRIVNEAVGADSRPVFARSDHDHRPTLAAAGRIITLDQSERILYHQIHPAKLATT